MALSRDEFFNDDFSLDFGGLDPNAIDLSGLSEQVDQIANRLFPDQGLTATERNELAALTKRARGLEPIEFQPPQSTAIPGNPFSYDISPLIGGIQSGLQSVINAARERRSLRPSERGRNMIEGAEQMREYAKGVENPTRRAQILEEAKAIEDAAQATSLQGRLTALAQRQAEAKQAEEQQNQFMQQLFPDLAARLIQAQKEAFVSNVQARNRRRQTAQKYGFEEGLLSQRGEQRLDQLDRELQNQIKLLEEKQRLGLGPGGSGAQFASANDLRQTVSAMAENIEKEIVRIQNDFDIPRAEARRQINILEERKQGLFDNTLTQILKSIGMTQEQAEAYIEGDIPENMFDDEDSDDADDNGTIDWGEL